MVAKMFGVFLIEVSLLILGTGAVVSPNSTSQGQTWYITILTAVLGLTIVIIGFFLARFVDSVQKSRVEHDKRITKNELDTAVLAEKMESHARTTAEAFSQMNVKLNSNRELKTEFIKSMARLEGKIDAQANANKYSQNG